MAIDLPHFHDGLMTGITLGDASATVFLRKVSGEEYALALEGVEALQIEDLRQGNIIHSLGVTTGRVPEADTPFDRLFIPPHPAAEAKYHEAHASLMQRHVARIEAGETTLITITPSYGADLLAICQKVSCQPI